jgi:hypothetical protein
MGEKTNSNGAAGTMAKGKPMAISKMEAVRKAIAKLGRGAGRAQIRDYVKSHFGVEITADHVSTCRADVLRQLASKAKSAGAKAPPAKPTPATSATPKAPAVRTVPAKAAPAAARTKPAPAVAAAPSHGAKNGSAKAAVGISLGDILAVKELVARVGSSPLKTLIDAFTG